MKPTLQLRFTRTYKPYRIELIDFKHERYVGTNTPKNFSSLVRLVDLFDERGELLRRSWSARGLGRVLRLAHVVPRSALVSLVSLTSLTSSAGARR